MPILAVLAVSASVLIALLFVADATLEKNGSPVIVTSQRSGLPETRRHYDGIQILTPDPAPAPDMTSQAVRDAQPKALPEALMKIHPDARAARAEAPPEEKRVTNPSGYQHQYQQNQVVDRFSIKGQ